MSVDIKIEKMEQRHIKAIAKIERQCFSKPWSENAIAAELSNDSAHFFVAVKDDEVAGYMGMHCAADECYVANIGVLKDYRRRGIGKTLVKNAIDCAKEMGMSFISLEVRPSNLGAICLYENWGFQRIGFRKNFYSDPKEDGLIMTLYFNDREV